MKDCKKCFLSPDMCGAKNDEQKCERIYESKWSMKWDIVKDWVLFSIPLIFFSGAILLICACVHWQSSFK